MFRPRLLAVPAVVAASALLGACGSTATATAPSVTGRSSPSPSAHRSPPSTARPAPDPASVHADELGQVPVLMFHQVVARPEGDYDITPTELRQVLEGLAAHHYVPVTAAAYSTGRFDIPAGTSPVVLTFDDSTVSQFTLAADGTPKVGTAVAILQQVAAEHPGFRAAATFYMNKQPFGQSDPARSLTWLSRHGFEVANHTYDHADLRQLDDAGVQKEIGQEQALVDRVLPDSPPSTLALPYGSRPRSDAVALAGRFGPVAYHFTAVLLVGANPARSPFDRKFAAVAVPRIRVAHKHVEFDWQYWMPRLTHRYVSDGDPAHVSFPRAEQDALAPAQRARAQAY